MRFSGSFFGLIGLVIIATIATSFFALHPERIPFKNALSKSSASEVHPIIAEAVKGASTDTISVKAVVDGDTLILFNDEKVRLIGINAPEQGQPLFQEAKDALISLVFNKEITVEYDVEKKDMHGRTLAYIYVGDDFVNKDLVGQGLAVTETIPPNVAKTAELTTAQTRAREECNGMWQGLCSQGFSACVQIARINSDPKGIDSVNLNNEYIELANTCSSAQNMKGYLLKDSSASNSYLFKELFLGAKQKLKLHSGCGINSNSDVYWECPQKSSAVWNNSGDSAYLYDNTGRLVSEMGY